MSNGPWLYEREVAAGIGVALERMAGFRGVEGSDWRKTGRGVQWSREAAETLATRLAGAKALPEKARATLSVEVATFLNRKIMECRTAAGELVTCRVPDARLFEKGMTILAEHYEGATWDYRGNPATPNRVDLPRRKGVW